MIKINKIKNTCSACLSQWEGTTDDNRNVYARYRWGHLSVCFIPSGEEIFDLDYGAILDGVMDYFTLKKLTLGIIEFPENDEYETY
jgi:hypothetical protein